MALTDLDERATVLSIDGLGAFDLISRVSMLEGPRSIEGGDSVLPFLLQFHGNPSSNLWEDDEGTIHEIDSSGRRVRTGRSPSTLLSAPELYFLATMPS